MNDYNPHDTNGKGCVIWPLIIIAMAILALGITNIKH